MNMDLWQRDNWFAIHTKPCQEEVAAMHIRRLGLEVLLPKILREKRVWNTTRRSVKPLFPGYLFAKFSPATFLHIIRYVRGARTVVSAGGLPLPVDEEIIWTIRSEMGSEGYAQVKSEPLRPGDEVMVNQGPLQGLTGIFERELDDSKRVSVLLKAIEYQARLTIERDYLGAAVAAAG
jgi:transcriptional antiterminator RfaH